MSDDQLPDDWVSTIRMWAVDQPAIRKITAVWTPDKDGAEASDLRLVLTTTSDGYGNALAPFIERRAGWAKALRVELDVPVELEHASFVRASHTTAKERTRDIWASRHGNEAETADFVVRSV